MFSEVGRGDGPIFGCFVAFVMWLLFLVLLLPSGSRALESRIGLSGPSEAEIKKAELQGRAAAAGAICAGPFVVFYGHLECASHSHSNVPHMDIYNIIV